ncbi:Gliding motility-associated ABC transporter substrate-binding protein GldG [hydrothermal vent metagenome]|uniref:Gliding motility-associated ABC transporter substrate-binding protein GldG n=1 Tax=hydrothermal vent metagenome TaxID=652676 RepID=A0A3B1D6M5_9ZZZZ
MLTQKKLRTNILLVFVILVLLNLVGDKIFFRLDFTADQRYSLSDATKNILKDLNEPVTVTAYFSEDLPPNVAKVRQDFRDLLVEYGSYSDGMVVYEFINPNEDQESEMKAQQNGIRPIMINVRERDQVKQQRAYLGAVVELGDKKEVIPFIQPGAAMEFALSSSIKKLSVDKKPTVAFLQGQGEPTLAAQQQVVKSLSIMYKVDTLSFDENRGVPASINTVVVIAPKDSVPDYVFKHLDDFLARGGNLLVTIQNVKSDLSTARLDLASTGFDKWLKTKGLKVGNEVLIDNNSGSIMVRQQQGMFTMNTPVKFPYLPIITNFAKHPITEGLESVMFPFSTTIELAPVDTSVFMVPLAVSSDISGTRTLPLTFNIEKQWRKHDFGKSKLPVAVALEGKLSGDTKSKMVVFSCGDFAVNGIGEKAQQLQPDNVSLLVNSIDWLSDDTGLIELRTKGVSSRPIDPSLEDGTKTMIKYINFLLPILLIILYGIFRAQRRRKKRNKIKSIDYVK